MVYGMNGHPSERLSELVNRIIDAHNRDDLTTCDVIAVVDDVFDLGVESVKSD